MLNNGLLLLAAFMQIEPSISGPAPPPCDSFEADGTPCVAAHSIVRALYAKYTGRLYRVRHSHPFPGRHRRLRGPGTHTHRHTLEAQLFDTLPRRLRTESSASHSRSLPFFYICDVTGRLFGDVTGRLFAPATTVSSQGSTTNLRRPITCTSRVQAARCIMVTEAATQPKAGPL